MTKSGITVVVTTPGVAVRKAGTLPERSRVGLPSHAGRGSPKITPTLLSARGARGTIRLPSGVGLQSAAELPLITEDPCITADTVAKYSCVRTRMSGVEAGVDFTSPTVPAASPQGETVTQVAVPTYTPEEAAARAWTTQIFTKPGVDIQPVGNTTLTGLPTYFRAAFGAEGLAPGESVTTTVLGHTVTIRPASALYTYHYGDGTSHGPTPDAGGVYPSGAVTHTYARKGVVNTRIDVTLTGEFRIGGGAWQPIPGSTTVAGTPEQLTVAILQSRLHH